jgi:hypothetical protein
MKRNPLIIICDDCLDEIVEVTDATICKQCDSTLCPICLEEHECDSLDDVSIPQNP